MAYFEEPVWIDIDSKEPVGITNSHVFGFGIRKYYDDNGTLKPGRKGINFKERDVGAVIAQMIEVAINHEILTTKELSDIFEVYLDGFASPVVE